MIDMSEKEIREKLLLKQTKACGNCKADINTCFSCSTHLLFRRMLEEAGLR